MVENGGSVITMDDMTGVSNVNMTENGSAVQPSGPKKLKRYTESQSTCLVVN